MLSSVSSIVSESLIVKDKFRLRLSESELASHFCLQVPGWCPCGNCRDFVPSVSLLVEAEDLVKDNLKICNMNRESYRLMLKRKASATGTATPNAAGGGKKAIKEHATASQDTNEEFTNQPNKRFQFDSFSNDLQSFKEGECAVNTAKSNEWALKNFETWRNARNKKFPDYPCPEDVFSNKKTACDWLCKFVCETRKGDGKEYTPRSLYLLLNGLQRHIRRSASLTEEFNLWKDPEFTPLKMSAILYLSVYITVVSVLILNLLLWLVLMMKSSFGRLES